MPTPVSVLLAVKSHATRDYLSALIQNHKDILIVGDVVQPLEILVTVAESKAQVVVLELPDGAQDPGICSHLLGEFPDLLILALSTNREKAILYRQKIVKKQLNRPSDRQILSAIRRAKVAATT